MIKGRNFIPAFLHSLETARKFYETTNWKYILKKLLLISSLALFISCASTTEKPESKPAEMTKKTDQNPVPEKAVEKPQSNGGLDL